MPRPCSICQHPERTAINEALFRNGTALRNIAERFEVAVTSLHRHKKHALAAAEQEVRSRAIANLPIRKQRYLDGLIGGKSKRQAALAAGYSKSMAAHPTDKIETRDVREALASVIRTGISPQRILERVSEGMDAQETQFFQKNGEVTDSRDVVAWTERRAYTELAAQLGYGAGQRDRGAKDGQGGGVIIVLPRSEPEPSNRTVIEAEQQGAIVIAPKTTEN